MEIEIRGKRFWLDHRRAIFAIETRQLILADLHVGKSSHFRKSGYSLPAYSFQKDIQQLIDLATEYQPDEIIFLGDLFHSSFNDEFIRWHQYMKEHVEADLRLVVGNHDKLTVKKNGLLSDFELGESFLSGDFCFTHYPTKTAERFNFCGHIHPGVRLQGLGLQRLKVPCFWLLEDRLVLPAFSELTGLGVVKPQESDRVFTCAGDKVIEV